MEFSEKSRPVIGITIGDFNGIGPEIILKCLLDNRILNFCVPVVYGSSKIFGQYRKLLKLNQLNYHHSREIGNINNNKINIINCWQKEYKIQPGYPDDNSGLCALYALNKATSDLKKGKIDALVTGPVSKKNIRSDQFRFFGHTDFLCYEFGLNEVLMCMISDKLRLGVVTDHIPLNQITEKINPDLINNKIDIMLNSLKNDFLVNKPKIAVMGINPHAGEEGEIGTEEKDILIPVINQYRQKGELVFGPYASDGFFGAHDYKKFDAVMALYHDQGLIPFKMLSFDEGVNFTAGLGAIRTSPDHGTAFNIAGRNIADTSSFRNALFLACDMYKNKMEKNFT